MGALVRRAGGRPVRGFVFILWLWSFFFFFLPPMTRATRDLVLPTSGHLLRMAGPHAIPLYTPVVLFRADSPRTSLLYAAGTTARPRSSWPTINGSRAKCLHAGQSSGTTVRPFENGQEETRNVPSSSVFSARKFELNRKRLFSSLALRRNTKRRQDDGSVKLVKLN